MRHAVCALLAVSAWGAALPADEPEPRPPRKLEASIGAGVVGSPRPYAGVDTAIFPVPIGTLSYGRFWIRGVSAGYRVVGGRGGGVDVFARPRFDGFDPNDSTALGGMAERELSADLGLALSRRRQHFEIELAATADVLDRSDGKEVALEVGFPHVAGDWRLTPAAAVVWQGQNLVDYYYGVRPHEALPDRPAYGPGSAVNGRAKLTASHRFSDTRWSILGIVSVERPGREIRDSPIVDASVTVGGFAGFLYSF